MRGNKLLILIFLIALVVANVIVVWPLFQGEYDKNTASIGIAHTIYASFFERFGWYTWNPFWYGGFPQHLIYPILEPVVITLTSFFLQISLASAYRILEGVAYVLVPIGVFFLTRYLTKSFLAGVFASLIFAFAPSANYFLIPSFSGIAKANNFAPWQLSVLLDYGEGSHTMSLPLIPFAAIFYLTLLKKPSVKMLILTSLTLALIVLFNLFSTYSIIFLFMVIFFSEVALGDVVKKLKISFVLVLLTYGFVAFAYDFTMIKAILSSGYIHPENIFHLPKLTNLVLGSLFLLPTLIIVYELIKKREHLQKYVILSGWFLIFFLIPFTFYRFHYWIGSQPNRYMPELNIVVSIIVGSVIALAIERARNLLPSSIRRVSVLGMTFVFVFLIFMSARPYLSSSWRFVEANKDITKTAEYKIARWMEANIDRNKGERIYLTGSPAFFANAFADIMQIRGAADNGQPDRWWADVAYQINKGNDVKIANDWLSVYGVRFIAVEGPVTTTPYRDFENPNKFEGILEKKADIDGFRIYETKTPTDMFTLVNTKNVLSASKIDNVLDNKGVLNFEKAINTEREVSFDYSWWKTPSLAQIQVSGAETSDSIFFRTTFDPGWQAKIGNEKVGIKKVGPGMMLISPNKNGNYTISLSWHISKSVYLGWGITLTTVMVCMWLLNKKMILSQDFE